jgi:hypothetical protein
MDSAQGFNHTLEAIQRRDRSISADQHEECNGHEPQAPSSETPRWRAVQGQKDSPASEDAQIKVFIRRNQGGKDYINQRGIGTSVAALPRCIGIQLEIEDNKCDDQSAVVEGIYDKAESEAAWKHISARMQQKDEKTERGPETEALFIRERRSSKKMSPCSGKERLFF